MQPLPSAEPFLLPGGATGCLLIHGFPGSPAEMRGLGDHLAAQGCTVLGVRLAGYGGDPSDLRATTWRDWLASAEAGFAELRRHCSRVVVVGFSMGGALTLLLARRHAFERMVLLATPLMLQGDWRVNVLPVVRYLIPWFYPLERADFSDPFIQQRIREYAPDADLDDPQIQAAIRRTVKIPVSAIDELRKLIGHARGSLPYVRIPALVMHGRNDDIAPPASAQEIADRLAASDKRLIWWERTGHQMLAVGPERDAIYTQIGTFVER